MDFEKGRAVCAPVPPPTPTSPTSGAPRCQAVARERAGVVLLNRYWGALEPPIVPGTDDATVGGGRGVSRPLPCRPPRPESYREDAAAARGICEPDGASRRTQPRSGGGGSDCGDGAERVGVGPDGICHELAAAAESGWDFSSRWGDGGGRDAPAGSAASAASYLEYLEGMEGGLVATGVAGGGGEGDAAVGGGIGDESGRQGDWKEDRNRGEGRDRAPSAGDESFSLCDTATTAFVPVDLNAFMHRAELNIARLHHAHHVASVAAASGCDASDEPEQHPLPGAAEVAGAHAATTARDDGHEDSGARSRENTKSSTRGRRCSSSDSTTTNATPPPPPALLTLDEIQRQYLSRDRRVYGSSSGFVTLDRLPPEMVGGVSVAAVPGGVDRGSSGSIGVRQDRDCSDDSEAGVGGSAGGYGLGFDVRAVVRSRGALCQKAMLYLAAARARAKAIEQTMWDDERALWRDLVLPTGQFAYTSFPTFFSAFSLYILDWSFIRLPVCLSFFLYACAFFPAGGNSSPVCCCRPTIYSWFFPTESGKA